MNRLEHLLQQLGEECNEVGQRASKANRFGPWQTQDGKTLNNMQRIRLEYLDLVAMLQLIERELNVPGYFDVTDSVSEELIKAKKARVEAYLQLAKNLGTYQDETYVDMAQASS
jgi:hypothetical protein